MFLKLSLKTFKNVFTSMVWTGKPSQYITNTTDNSAFYPSEVSKSSTGLKSGWG